MIRKHRWLWIGLFIWIAVLILTLATGWYVVLVDDYVKMLELARMMARPHETHAPWASLILGTMGFVAALVTTFFLFIRLLREMKLNQLQSEFLAAVTHELKTPIAAIELSSTMIRTGELSKEETEGLWNTHQIEVKRLREEVETLLEAARWESHKLSIASTPILIENWLSDCFDRWKGILGPGAALAREGEPLMSMAHFHLRTVNLITDNILSNARKFSKGTPSVVVRTRRILPPRPWQAGRWQIEFQDSGWGFDPKDAKKIFSRFFRAKTSAPYAIPGTGLGLYLAASASQALGLRIRGHSAGLGLGATFILEGPEHRDPLARLKERARERTRDKGRQREQEI